MARKPKKKKLYATTVQPISSKSGLIRPPTGRSGPARSVEVEEYKRSLQEGNPTPDNTPVPAKSPSDSQDVATDADFRSASPLLYDIDLYNFLGNIDNVPLSELQLIWSIRQQLPLSRQSAYEIFSRMRYLSGIDAERRSYFELEEHPSLTEFDVEPTRSPALGSEAPSIGKNHQIQETELTGDKRVRTAQQTARDGQSRFRERLALYYGMRCMVSGETLSEVIEAAHISPYDGEKSNGVENGLLLRVDIHRLFDRGLILIAPDTHIICIAPSIQNGNYGCYHGKQLLLSQPSFFDEEALRRRYMTASLSCV